MTPIVTPFDGLRVAPHIRLCPIDDQVIVLDLLNSRYAGIARAPFAALSVQLGWPQDVAPISTSRDPAPLIDSLLSRGWLVRSTVAHANPPTETQLPEATRTLPGQGPATHPVVTFRRALRCLRSSLAASWRLRHRSLLAAVDAVTRRQEALRQPREASSHGELIDAASAYLGIRPLLFSARDRCLHDSLTLVTFLAAEQIPARWVIGVRIRPFAAHSWVQHDGLVLNDQHERVRAYRPILVV